MLAKVLEVELAKLEPDQQGNDELIGNVRWASSSCSRWAIEGASVPCRKGHLQKFWAQA